MQSLVQGITIADPNLPDCPLMYVNEAFCRMTGYAREEIIGRNCRFLQGPDTDAAAVVRIREALEQVTPLSICGRGLQAAHAPVQRYYCWSFPEQ